MTNALSYYYSRLTAFNRRQHFAMRINHWPFYEYYDEIVVERRG